MLHLDFSDFSLIEYLALPELPGCPRATIRETAALVFADFCGITQCFKERLEMIIETDVSEYDLVSPHDQTMVIGVAAVDVGGRPLIPGDYTADSPSRIVFAAGIAGVAKITLILKSTLDAVSAPADILNRWAEVIAHGVKFRLLLMPDKPWSNPQLAGHYRSEYDRECSRVASDVRNEFSVSRHGRAGFTYSVYGV